MKCYICSSDHVVLHKKVNHFDLCHCKECGLIWAADVDPKEIDTFYDENYYNSLTKTGYQNYIADETNHRSNAASILNTVSKIKKIAGSRILDIGCAHGFLLDEARKMGGQTFGVELSEEAYGYAKNRLGLNVINEPLGPDLYEKNFFDAIFLICTIEHLIDPRETLAQADRILKKSGLLIVTTIDTAGLLPFFSLKPPEHLFYFNERNLLNPSSTVWRPEKHKACEFPCKFEGSFRSEPNM